MKPHGKKRRRNGNFISYRISPFLPMESQRAASGALGFLNLFQLIKNGIWPARGDNTRWYDRLIHVVGGTLILLTLGAGLVMLAIEALKRSH
jgi:hypothetical protein